MRYIFDKGIFIPCLVGKAKRRECGDVVGVQQRLMYDLFIGSLGGAYGSVYSFPAICRGSALSD